VANLGAHLSVPILLADGKVYGTLCCFSHQPKPTLGNDDADALRSVAQLVATGIQRNGELRQQLWAGNKHT
jgi:GAF domain-containing protein